MFTFAQCSLQDDEINFITVTRAVGLFSNRMRVLMVGKAIFA